MKSDINVGFTYYLSMDAEARFKQVSGAAVKVDAPDIFSDKQKVEQAIGSMAGRVHSVLRDENAFDAMQLFKQWRSDYLREGLVRTHPSLRKEKVASEDAHSDPLGRHNHHKVQQDEMELSQMAVGWLMAEGWVKPRILGEEVKPESQRVEGSDRFMFTLLPEKERGGYEWNQGFGFDDKRITKVFVKTAGYGMSRRQATEGGSVGGFDSAIGRQAGLLLASMGGRKKFMGFEELVDKACEGTGIKSGSDESLFLTAAAVGWRLAEEGVKLRGDFRLDDLTVAPRFSQDPKTDHQKILGKAHDIIDHLRDEGGLPLKQLISGGRDQVFMNSLLVGYLGKKRLVEFEQREGESFISARG
ncbi:MAG: hypothetical protein GF334_00275 [Candidatus Altiarchaeales archaeon]|nr:hypothetical protein [Candidatus Altiarchaeales archaeon]